MAAYAAATPQPSGSHYAPAVKYKVYTYYVVLLVIVFVIDANIVSYIC